MKKELPQELNKETILTRISASKKAIEKFQLDKEYDDDFRKVIIKVYKDQIELLETELLKYE